MQSCPKSVVVEIPLFELFSGRMNMAWENPVSTGSYKQIEI